MNSVYSKTLSGKIFAVKVRNCHSRENFRTSILVDLHCYRQGHNSWETIRDD